MTGTYHYIAILAQQDLFPSEPTEERKESEARSASRVTANGHTTDSLDTVKRRLADNKAVLVDVREKKEWDAGHLKSAQLVPLSEIKKNADNKDYAKKLGKKISKKKIIYCHCRSGGRVIPASKILFDLGYDIRPLKFGYDDLRKVPWENLRYEHVLQIREYLQTVAKKSYASVNATLSAIRAVVPSS